MNDIYNIATSLLLYIVAPCVFVNFLLSLLNWAINAPYNRDVHITTKKWYYE